MKGRRGSSRILKQKLNTKCTNQRPYNMFKLCRGLFTTLKRYSVQHVQPYVVTNDVVPLVNPQSRVEPENKQAHLYYMLHDSINSVGKCEKITTSY